VRFLNYGVMAVKKHRHCSFVAILALKVKASRWQELGVVALTGKH
jgi:hypothetical protein